MKVKYTKKRAARVSCRTVQTQARLVYRKIKAMSAQVSSLTNSNKKLMDEVVSLERRLSEALLSNSRLSSDLEDHKTAFEACAAAIRSCETRLSIKAWDRATFEAGWETSSQ